MLQLLTMTGARPEAWELCKGWMREQDYKGPVHWLVVDDGPQVQSMAGLPEGWRVSLICPEPFWRPGQNTQRRNILAGLDHYSGGKLLVIEDDDYYSPTYLSCMAKELESADLVGESRAIYFNLAVMRGADCKNERHASLCQTGMNRAAVEKLRQVCETNTTFFDVELWRQFDGAKSLKRTRNCIGIKGLPGRGGIGAGHRMRTGGICLQDFVEMVGDEVWSKYCSVIGNVLK